MFLQKIQKKTPSGWLSLGYAERFIGTATILGLFGILMVYSASATFSRSSLNADSFYFLRQVSFFFIGWLVFAAIMKLPIHWLENFALPLLLISLLLMALVLVPGVGEWKYGARRWIRFFNIGIQPSELLKVAAIAWTADFLKRKNNQLQNWVTGVVPMLMVVGVCSVLLLLQPDFGDILLLTTTVFVMGFYAGVRFRDLFVLFLLLLLGSAVAIFTNPYRLSRLNAYLDPWADPNDTGFQLVNSILAFGSGGIFGKGLGNSLQKQFFLPFPQTDFIFATIGEELGLIGVVCLFVLFFLLLHSGFKLVGLSRDPFHRYFILGVTLLIIEQALLHFGVVLGLVPTKGIGLPLVSYGGSSLVSYFFALAWVYKLGKFETKRL